MVVFTGQMVINPSDSHKPNTHHLTTQKWIQGTSASPGKRHRYNKAHSFGERGANEAQTKQEGLVKIVATIVLCSEKSWRGSHKRETQTWLWPEG